MTESDEASRRVDVLVLAALQMEFDAARKVMTSGYEDASGVATWSESGSHEAAPYIFGDYVADTGQSLRIALARPVRMGSTTTAAVASALAARLKPSCLAMCGVCAGNPADVALGDVVIAEMAYAYDEGKRTLEGFEGDHRQHSILDNWQRVAQELTAEGLPSYGAACQEDAEFWLLERLYNGDDPRKHPARPRYFPEGSWKSTVQKLEASSLVKRQGASLVLTETGRDAVDQSLVYNLDPPGKLPFAIHVGPIASGSVVVKDSVTWLNLKKWGVRSVIGLEMEAAAIGGVARSAGISQWIVIKGVMDHADPRKDDRYKPFAARASAEVLMRFLSRPGVLSPPTKVDESSGVVGSSLEPAWRARSLGDQIYDQMADAISLNAPRFRGLFDRARTSALRAYEEAEKARQLAEQIQRSAGSKLTAARAKYKSTKRKTFAVPLEVANPAPPFMIVVWSSGDEYAGQASGDQEHGYGVYKVYVFGREFASNQVSQFAGLHDCGRYGPSGVFTFPDQAQLAGDWVDGHPHFGYREFFGEHTGFDADFYMGHFAAIEQGLQPLWKREGEGIAVDAQGRTIRCAMFRDGEVVHEYASFNF